MILFIQSTFRFYLFEVASKEKILSNTTANDKSSTNNMVSERQEAAPCSGAILDKTVFS